MSATKFIHARIVVAPGIVLVVDGNSKVTAANGTYSEPKPNAFSLPAASVSGSGHCPGSTPTCRASCYVHGLAKFAPDVYAAYSENAAALADMRLRGMAYGAAMNFGRWIAANCAGGFRWHVSGDVEDKAHAWWIVDVCRYSPRVQHWIYTRTLEAVPALRTAQNLAVNVSADRDNFEAAHAAAVVNGARLAYMASPGEKVPTLPPGSVIFPDYPLRGRSLPVATDAPWWAELTHEERRQVCPADFFGQSEAHRCGPCDKCLRPNGAP